MMLKQKAPQLKIRRGIGAGKEIGLKGEELRIGSEAGSDLLLNGRYVSKLHAILRQGGDGRWEVENRSVNGTIVNGGAVTTHPLENGDMIVIGGDTELEFQLASPEKPKPKAANPKPRPSKERPEEDGPDTGPNKLSAKKVILSVALGIYLLGFVVLIGLQQTGYFDGEGDRVGVSMDRIGEVLNVTRDEIGAKSAGTGGTKDCPVSVDHEGYRLAIAAGPAVLSAVRGGDSAGDAQQLLARIEDQLQEAWREEKQGHIDEAMERYKKVFESLHGIQFCVVRYAAERIRVLSKQ